MVHSCGAQYNIIGMIPIGGLVQLPLLTATGGHGSPYLALVVLFPSAAPLIRRLAMLFPDAKLRKWIQVGRMLFPWPSCYAVQLHRARVKRAEQLKQGTSCTLHHLNPDPSTSQVPLMLGCRQGS